MRKLMLLPLILFAGACAPGGYVATTVVYREPPAFVYEDVDLDRVVIVSRAVLVDRGYVVYRVGRDGPNRIIWARRGDGEIVRVFLTPDGRRVAVRGVREVRDRDHRVWVRREAPDEVIRDIDRRVRERR